MTLARLGQAFERAPPLDRQLWRMLAYAGKYGSTPPNLAMQLTASDLRAFTAELSQLLKEEAEAVERARND